jgi:hypothetical protein
MGAQEVSGDTSTLFVHESEVGLRETAGHWFSEQLASVG